MSQEKGPPEYRKRLAEVAAPFVKPEAASKYAEYRGEKSIETARRELTRIVALAHYRCAWVAGGDGFGDEEWRRLDRRRGLEVRARVAMEDELAVVTDVIVRGYKP